jgi:hypothetical protein
MIAFLSEGMPSDGAYLISPPDSRAAEARIAVIGALFFGSPMPRWMTDSPFSRRILASSFRRRVGDSTMELASLLRIMARPLSRVRKGRPPAAATAADPRDAHGCVTGQM